MPLLRNKNQQQNNPHECFATYFCRKRSGTSSHHCITPEQRTWLVCSVSVIPVNKLSWQELDQLIGIKLLTSRFLKKFGS